MLRKVGTVLGIILIILSLSSFIFIYHHETSLAKEKEKRIEEANALIKKGINLNKENQEENDEYIHIVDYKILSDEERKEINEQSFRKHQENLLKERLEFIKNYDVEDGEMYGTIEIPELNIKSALFEGVDMEDLKSGVGKYSQTGFPDQNKQIFLVGHNNTSFKGVDKLKEGAEIIITTEYGEYKYKMFKREVVHQSRTDLVGEEVDKETLVLMTCYPYWNINTDERLLIYAERVD